MQHSEEAKRKMRLAKLGRKLSAQTKAKIGASQLAYRRRVKKLVEEAMAQRASAERETVS